MVVTDHFFCPALEVISDFFKLPENVAGATLLSFGNGAPDFFTQLAAIATVRGVNAQCMYNGGNGCAQHGASASLATYPLLRFSVAQFRDPVKY